MKQIQYQSDVQIIPIEKIHILNPRIRNQKIFKEMVANITKVGLKRPITVVKDSSQEGKEYDLVCGQGRIEAFQACGETHIPAFVVSASEEDTLVMSLVENIARRQHRVFDLLHGIGELHKQGYDAKSIANKIGVSADYIGDILKLITNGEERLIYAVEKGIMPISLALKICEAPAEDQQILQDIHQNEKINGKRLLDIMRILEQRRRRGKDMRERSSRAHKRNSVQDILKAYQKEVDKKKHMVQKAAFANHRLTVFTEAFKRLLKEDYFITLLG